MRKLTVILFIFVLLSSAQLMLISTSVYADKLLSYEILDTKDVSIAGCTRIAENILVPSGSENNIPAIKKLITKILNHKNHFCEYSVYALIKGKEYIPIIYGKYNKERDSITFHSNESTFYGMYPRGDER